jgi:antitoxin component of RelBE/YafQ-DinJ toxin-antitoxin module
MVLEKDVLLAVRVSSTLKKAVDGAAEKSGLTSAEWIRAVLARAANEGAFAPRKGDRHGSKPKRKPTE